MMTDRRLDVKTVEESLRVLQNSELVASTIAGDELSKSKLLAASRQLTFALEDPDDLLSYAQFWVSQYTESCNACLT